MGNGMQREALSLRRLRAAQFPLWRISPVSGEPVSQREAREFLGPLCEGAVAAATGGESFPILPLSFLQ